MLPKASHMGTINKKYINFTMNLRKNFIVKWQMHKTVPFIWQIIQCFSVGAVFIFLCFKIFFYLYSYQKHSLNVLTSFLIADKSTWSLKRYQMQLKRSPHKNVCKSKVFFKLKLLFNIVKFSIMNLHGKNNKFLVFCIQN